MKKTTLSILPSANAARAARRFVSVLACGGALVLLAGCDTEPESHLVSAPPPSVVSTAAVTTTTVASSPAVGPVYVTSPAMPIVSTTVVTQAPPAPPAEVMMAQPSPGYVWLAGYWTWRDSRYEWMAGHWELPPSSYSAWVAPRWEQQGNAYRFYEGHWN